MSVARSIGGEDVGRATSMRKVGVAAFIGALVEWCDSGGGPNQLRLGVPGHGVLPGGPHRRAREGAWGERSGPDDLARYEPLLLKKEDR